jgi:hypothetical protein
MPPRPPGATFVRMEALALDTLAVCWREALGAAEDSLEEVSHCRRALQFPTAELQERLRELQLERREAEVDLELLARTTHATLHHHLLRPQ